jgi:tRNA G18 (ribose-2'-O)-methylase SpoU
MWVGGIHVLERALASGRLKEVWLTPGMYETIEERFPYLSSVRIVPQRELQRRFGEEGSFRVVSRIELPPLSSAEDLVRRAKEEGLPLLLLEELKDPQNLGSIARSVFHLGGAGIVLTRHRTVPLTPSAIRASSGYLLEVPCAFIGGAPSFLLKIKGALPTYATVPEGGIPPWEISLAEGSFLLFGEEGRGLKPLTIRRCDHILTIPMRRGGESLNVAQCATALLYEAMRQRFQGSAGR